MIKTHDYGLKRGREDMRENNTPKRGIFYPLF
jgi:hypothetical protein